MTSLGSSATGGSRTEPAVRQHRTARALAMSFIVVLLLLQLWLLVSVIEGVLGGAGAIVFPATLVSGICCSGTWWLWWLLRRHER